MIDRAAIGLTMRRPGTVVEAGQLRLFAKATGQTEAVFVDDAAARAAGHRGLLAPPTFIHCLLAIGKPDPFDLFAALGIALERTLHGEQAFDYGVALCAGDVVDFETRVTDIYARRDGELEFLVAVTKATNQLGERVADFRCTTIVVNRA